MYHKLKQQIQQQSGTISKIAHCKQLSDSVFQKTNIRISESTLWRIFTKNSEYMPHEYTLDVLSDFLGYGNWREFSNKNKKLPIAENDHHLTLLEMSLENHQVETVVRFLKTLPNDYSMELTDMAKIAGVIGSSVVSDEKLRNKLLPELTKFEQGRIFFTETYVDELNFELYYEKNIKRYLKTKMNDSLKASEDDLFGLNLLYKHALWNNEKSKIYTYSKLIKSLGDNAFIKQEKVHVFPYFRYRNFLLVQRYLERKISPLTFVNKMIDLCDEFVDRHPHFYLFIKITAEYLIYFQFYEEAKLLLEKTYTNTSFSNCIYEEIDVLLGKVNGMILS